MTPSSSTPSARSAPRCSSSPGASASSWPCQSIPTLKHYGPSFFSVHEGWNFDTDRVSVASLLVGTVEVALIAISIAFPLALATALYISEYAPPKLQATLISAIDLMAAVPSIVFGLWARDLIQPHAGNVAMFVDRHVGPFAVHGNKLTFLVDLMLTSAAIWVVVRWAAQVKSRWAEIPLYISLAAAVALLPVCFTVNADPNAANLAPQQSSFQKSAFIAGIAVAMMVLPMACAVMRQVFSQTPPGEKEAALALGATRWGMIRAVVLPFGTRRHHRRHDARPRPRARRDHRGPADHLARSSRSSPTSSRSARRRCRR